MIFLEFYGTIGPACAQLETLQRMVEAGMTGIRMNLSHGPLSAHKDWLDIIHAVGIPQLLIDLQGPELRIGTLPQPLVLDADGINALSGHIDTLSCRRGLTTVLTPHDGELARIGGDMTAPRESSAAFAARHGVCLVRKGHRTVIAAPDGRLAVNTTGSDGMAKGGSGDVLTGLLTGLLAQGVEPFAACCCAVWLHGRAGDLAAEEKGHRGMTPADMIEKLPYALKEVE